MMALGGRKRGAAILFVDAHAIFALLVVEAEDEEVALMA